MTKKARAEIMKQIEKARQHCEWDKAVAIAGTLVCADWVGTGKPAIQWGDEIFKKKVRDIFIQSKKD